MSLIAQNIGVVFFVSYCVVCRATPNFFNQSSQEKKCPVHSRIRKDCIQRKQAKRSDDTAKTVTKYQQLVEKCHLKMLVSSNSLSLYGNEQCIFS